MDKKKEEWVMNGKEYICVSGVSSIDQIEELVKRAKRSHVPVFVSVKREHLNLSMMHLGLTNLVEINEEDYAKDKEVMLKLALRYGNVVRGFLINDFSPPWSQIEELKAKYPDCIVLFNFGLKYTEKCFLGTDISVLCSFVRRFSDLIDYFIFEDNGYLPAFIEKLQSSNAKNISLIINEYHEPPFEVRGLHLDISRYLTAAV